MSRTTHAGGVIRAVMLTDGAAGRRTLPLARPTPVREWKPADRERKRYRELKAGRCRDWLAGDTKGERAFIRRVARRRARKGYRYQAGERL